MKSDLLIKLVGILGVLLLISVFFNIKDSGISEITGSSVQQKVVICNEKYMRHGEGCCLDLDLNNICDEDEKLVKDSGREVELLNQIQELEDKLEEIEEEKEIEAESCPLVCDEDEICVPLNKADGSLKWLCVDDPEQLLGSG
jgi:hypothetical protein